MEHYTATVEDITELNTDSYLLRLKLPDNFTFQPGQFIMLEFGRNPDGFLVRRAYSVASTTSELPVIELAIKVSPVGSKSHPYLQKLRPGDSLPVDGPNGLFLYQTEPERRKLFIAAGSGIAPIMCMLRTWQAEPNGGPVSLIYGAKNRSHLFYFDELQQIKEQTFLDLTFTTDEGGQAEIDLGIMPGFPTDHLDVLQPSPATDTAYLCGPPPMVAAAEAKLLLAGFERSQIKKERY